MNDAERPAPVRGKEIPAPGGAHLAAAPRGPSRGTRLATTIFGLAGLLLFLVMLAAALFLAPGDSPRHRWYLVAAAAGALLFLIYLIANAREIGGFFASRQFRYGTNVAVMLVATAAIVVVVNLLGHRFYAAADWTTNANFTLSTETKALLDSLKSDVQVLTFFPDGGDLSRLQDLLDRYKRASSRVHVRYVNIVDEGELKPLVAKYHLTEPSVVVVEYKGKTKIVPGTEIFTTEGPMNPEMPVPPKQIFKGEDAMTAAVRSLQEEKPVTVCFTTGFGEAPITSGQEGGFVRLAEEIRRLNMTVDSLPMFNIKAIPDTCDVLVVAGPRRPYDANAVKAVKTYLDNGGHAIFLLDPNIDPSSDPPRIALTGFEDLLRGYGVGVDRSIVLDPSGQMLFRTATAFVVGDTGYQPHPITNSLQGAGTIWQMARSLSETPEHPGFRVTPLVKAAAQGWAETNISEFADEGGVTFDEGADIKGPVTIADAVSMEPMSPQEPEPQGTRLVVFGDVAFVTDQGMSPQSANRDLFVNSLRWLTGRTDTMGIAPKEMANTFFVVTSSQSRFIWIAMLGLIPLLSVAAGIVVWIVRR